MGHVVEWPVSEMCRLSPSRVMPLKLHSKQMNRSAEAGDGSAIESQVCEDWVLMKSGYTFSNV